MIPLTVRLACSPYLLALELRGYGLSRIDPTFLQNLSYNFDSLRYLEVDQPSLRDDLIDFLNFLACFPQPSHLKITPVGSAYNSELESLLPSTSIPHLSTIEAPYDLAGTLVHGRPVLSLRLWSARENGLDRKLFSRLAEGSTPLKRLNVDCGKWRDNVLLDIVEYFPTLQDLQFRVLREDFYPNLMLERLASDIKGFLPMQRFVIYHCAMGSPEDDFDHGTLKLLAVTNDRLALIGLRFKTERYEGNRRWVLLPLS
ncbi:hypothetical protein FRB94_014526 [Tulasnella sp. JGI-2019a]|nr:hypothetical protein FRB94_014526 [Tulasnella sp. JGI-2019a]